MLIAISNATNDIILLKKIKIIKSLLNKEDICRNLNYCICICWRILKRPFNSTLYKLIIHVYCVCITKYVRNTIDITLFLNSLFFIINHIGSTLIVYLNATRS